MGLEALDLGMMGQAFELRKFDGKACPLIIPMVSEVWFPGQQHQHHWGIIRHKFFHSTLAYLNQRL